MNTATGCQQPSNVNRGGEQQDQKMDKIGGEMYLSLDVRGLLQESL